MARASRDKGARGEREVAAIFAYHGFDTARTPNSGGLRVKGDLDGFAAYHIEVKRTEVLRVPTWLRQAESEAAGRTPIVAYRSNAEPWRAIVPLDVLAGLMARDPLRSQS